MPGLHASESSPRGGGVRRVFSFRGYCRGNTPEQPAQRFEQYQLIQLMTGEDGKPLELGRGAMGITYKAVDINLRCPVTRAVRVPARHVAAAIADFVQAERRRQRQPNQEAYALERAPCMTGTKYGPPLYSCWLRFCRTRWKPHSERYSLRTRFHSARQPAFCGWRPAGRL